MNGLERTICDCIRSRNQMDFALVTDALKRNVRRTDRNFYDHIRGEEVFRIVKPLRRCLEARL